MYFFVDKLERIRWQKPNRIFDTLNGDFTFEPLWKNSFK